MGSEPSAASGRYSEVSEWQRSIADEAALVGKEDIGHRNRNRTINFCKPT